MGISIHLMISKSVTKKEWEKVYEETLELIRHLPFAEKRKVKIHGIDTVCLVRTKERKETYGWNGEKTRVGWETVGDYRFMRTAEDYYLPRDIVEDDEIEEEALDAMFGALPACMNYDWEEKRFSHVYEWWGAKTQGEPYHMYLLAVAALIEARLGTKAFTYGDITRGQFKKAAEIANQYLEEPIDLPDRCYMDRLLKRVSSLPLTKREQLAVFEHFYLGTQDAEFGDYMRQTFPEDVIADYWEEKFKGSQIGTVGFAKIIHNYLLWGFDLEPLCDYVDYETKDGEPKYEAFVKEVMDAKLHLKEKNCTDPLEIDQNQEQPYSVAALFAQFMFGGARNKKVDRYIPIEEIRTVLVNKLSSKCNVEMIIEDYLKEESKQTMKYLAGKDASKEDIENAVKHDPAEAFGQMFDIKKKQLERRREKYDVDDYEDLIYYEDGDTMHPSIKKSIAESMKFLETTLDEDELKELLKKDAKTRCEWLVDHNRYLLIRDEDWDRIFTDIERNKNAFGRYYSLFRVKMDKRGLVHMCTAFMVNDETYNYAKKLAAELNEKGEL